jgi:hypothetical protein
MSPVKARKSERMDYCEGRRQQEGANKKARPSSRGAGQENMNEEPNLN